MGGKAVGSHTAKTWASEYSGQPLHPAGAYCQAFPSTDHLESVPTPSGPVLSSFGANSRPG